jgi:hypothetical protein
LFPQILAYFEAEKSELFDFYLIQTRLSEDQSKQWEWKEFLEGVAGAVQRLKDLVDEQNCLFRDLKEAAERMEQGQGRKKEMQIIARCTYVFEDPDADITGNIVRIITFSI